MDVLTLTGAVPTSHDLVMHLHFPVSGVKVHYDGHTFTYPLAGTARIIDIKAYVQHHYTQVLGYADKNALPDIDVSQTQSSSTYLL